MTLLLVGAGPTAIAYAKVLNAQGREYVAVGRGAASAHSFRTATGHDIAEGGIEAWLARNGAAADAAIVVTPIPQLAATTRALVGAGIRRILVEKPAGLDRADIAALDEACRAEGADVRVAYNRRFHASTLAARGMIEEDGGVSSFHFEFTEMAERILTPDKDPHVLANWFLANSSHVVDLAFHLGGEPESLAGQTAGALPWHPPGAVFAGSGRTRGGALFTWLADWSAPGRWGVDIRTPKRRLILQPMEQLKVQVKGSFAIEDVALDDELDRAFKPGFYRQVEAFLGDDRARRHLPTLAEHRVAVETAFLPILAMGN